MAFSFRAPASCTYSHCSHLQPLPPHLLSVIGRHTSAASPSDKTCLKSRVDILSHTFLTLFSRGFSHFFFVSTLSFLLKLTNSFVSFQFISVQTKASTLPPLFFFSYGFGVGSETSSLRFSATTRANQMPLRFLFNHWELAGGSGIIRHTTTS